MAVERKVRKKRTFTRIQTLPTFKYFIFKSADIAVSVQPRGKNCEVNEITFKNFTSSAGLGGAAQRERAASQMEGSAPEGARG